MKIEFKPKEIAIYEAFISLRDEGIAFEDIKVSEIAKKAGIGKGTVYEYFSSKEEILQKAVVYECCMNLNELEELLKDKEFFWDKLDMVFDWMEKKGIQTIQNFSRMKRDILIQGGNICECFMGEGFFERLEKLADEILLTGVKEQIIRPAKSTMERDMLLSGVVASYMSYTNYMRRRNLEDQSKFEEAKKIASDMLISYLKVEE